MKNKKRIIRYGVMGFLAVSLFAVLLQAPKMASGATLNPGDDGYVHANHYVQETDIKGVYRVQLTLEGKIRPKPVLITFVLDHSGSMAGSGYDDWVGQALEEALDMLCNPLQNPSWNHTYVNIISYGEESVWIGNNIQIDESSHSLTGCWAPGGYGAPGSNDAFQKLVDNNGNMNAIVRGAAQEFHNNFNSRPGNMTDGTWIGAGERRAYLDLMDLKNSASMPIPGTSYDDYTNYVMIMTDGVDNHDQFVESTQSWALALKLPDTVSVNVEDGALRTSFQAPPPPYASVRNTVTGAGATIWTIVTGTNTYAEHLPNWPQLFFNWHSGVTWPSADWPYQAPLWGFAVSPATSDNGSFCQEAAMAAVAAPLNVSGFSGVVNSFAASHAAPYTLTLADYLEFYYGAKTPGVTAYYAGTPPMSGYNTSRLLTSGENRTPYYYATSAADTATIFMDFSTNAISYGPNPIAQGEINLDYYSLYKMPDHPLLETRGKGAGAATISGGKITWNLDYLMSGEPVSLIFYVKMADGLDPNLYYSVLNWFDFNFELDQDPFEKIFPATIAKPEAVGGLEKAAEQYVYHQSIAWVLPDTDPIVVKDVKAEPLGGGKVKLTVVAKPPDNGGGVRYHWQYRLKDAEWQNIIGANGSVYTMKKLPVSEIYEFRCVLSNDDGFKTFSDIVIATVQ